MWQCQPSVREGTEDGRESVTDVRATIQDVREFIEDVRERAEDVSGARSGSLWNVRRSV